MLRSRGAGMVSLAISATHVKVVCTGMVRFAMLLNNGLHWLVMCVVNR